MQNTLLAVGLALIAAIVAALAAPLLIDWNAYRPQVEAEASRLMGRPVTIGGELSIRLLPTIQIDARDIALDDASGRARIGRLRAELRVAPLLRGNVSLTSVHVRDADIVVAGSQAATSFLPAEEVLVENARLSLAQAGAPPTLIAERMMLTGESRGVKGPLRLEGSVVTGERAVAVHLTAALTDAGSLAMRLRATDRETSLTVDAEGLVATQERPRFDGDIVLAGMAGRLPWRLSGKAAATADAVVFEKMDTQVGADDRAVRATGSLRIGLGGAGETEMVLSARQVDLDRLAEPAPGSATTPRDVIAALVREAPGLGRTSRPVSVGFDIAGLVLSGGQLADLRGDLRSDDGGWRVERLAARLPGGASLEASGRAMLAPDLGFSGVMAVQAMRPAALMSWLDALPTPEGTLDDPVRLAADVVAEPGRLSLDKLELSSPAGTARGRITLDVPALGRHALALDLAADALDLDLLLRLARGAGARLDPATDTRLQLRAEQVRLAGLAARGLDLSVATDGRTFDAERIRIADFAGFGMDMAGRLDGIGGPLVGRLSGRLRAANVDSLVVLLSRSPVTAQAAAWLRERAPSLADADLAMTFAAGGRSALGLRLDGRVGGGTLTVDAAGSGQIERPETLLGRVQLNVSSPRADQIYALIAGRTAHGATPGAPARLSVTVERPDTASLKVSGAASAAGTEITVSSETAGTARGVHTASLASTDLAPVMPLLGVPAELAGRLPARLDLRATSRGTAWQTQTLRGQVGPTTVEAELRGNGLEAAGRLRLGTLSGEALAALVSGPAWLIDTASGSFPDAAFGMLATDAIAAELDLTVERVLMGDAPPMTGLAARLSRRGARASLTQLAATMGPARLSGNLSLDRSPLRSILAGNLTLDGVPASLGWPGAAGQGRLAIELAGDGASPAALVASLQGTGGIAWSAMRASGVSLGALARATRQAEVAQDLGRPLSDMAFGAVLAQALEAPVDIAAATSRLTLSGVTLRLAETIFPGPGGRLAWSGSLDLAEGRLASVVRVTPDRGRDDEAVPAIVVRFDGTAGQATRRIDTDDVSGWLGLRLVDRAALRIQMSESDRLERARQRAFSRFTAHPPPPVVVPLPPVPDLSPDLLPPAEQATPAEPEPSREGVPVPARRPAEAHRPARPAAPQAGSDLPGVVRRALDGARPPAAPSAGAPNAGAPMSILPPLPAPVEVGPAPGMRR
ncbi:MAG: AsmA family protein [Phreatobacter sp.]|uniref:AsmA family protein n=1 Tax=Phreatobacter sp. TaxID=1966341 RepID=UPI001A5B57E1|nr:AsmA family protein [Phreatobacter sp.]MBL8569179.1 AsmA family protein [Phreatobacter sp.]